MDGYALIDDARGGVENMALDQRLLESAAENQSVWLRVYRWSEPTLSLGYFQPFAQRSEHPASSSLPVVRRATGGGAIVHHFDWTYCVAVPQNWLANAGSSIGASQPLYDLLHNAVVQWLNDIGIAASKWSEDCELSAGKLARGRQAPFLCFERRSCGDVVWGKQKVMGSAQRRIPGAVLQHGSLLLAPSPYAPSLPGLSGSAWPEGNQWSQAVDGDQQEPVVDLRPPLASERPPNRGYDLLTGEELFQRLVTALEGTGGMKLAKLPSLAESPIPWDWPKATRFAETNWTQRV